ncbi:MAG: phosphotransferase, partial [Clostridia bacterium]
EALTIIKTTDDQLFYVDEDKKYWRMYIFVDDAISYQTVDKPEHFYCSGKAFGKFQNYLSEFDATKLYVTIENFHNTPVRYENLQKAIKADVVGRVKDVKEEIDFCVNRLEDIKYLQGLLDDKKLPLRVTHNDTKLNNIMIDGVTGEGLCVIDLDTVMPGLAGYDFGDSIRFGANTAAEDEKDLSKVSLSLDLFEVFAKGYLSELASSLTPLEIETLPFAAKIMTLECGLRFLTDYISGDVYFKIHRENHNLDRCRTQFKLVQDMEAKMDAMNDIIKKII